jgi:hypothetical protein
MYYLTKELTDFPSRVSCLFCEYLYYFDVDMWVVVYYTKETVYNWLFVHVVHGRCRWMLASTYHSITHRTGKQSRRNQGGKYGTKAYVTNDGISYWIINWCSAPSVVEHITCQRVKLTWNDDFRIACFINAKKETHKISIVTIWGFALE